MCALSDESSAMDGYLPDSPPLLSTVVITHESIAFLENISSVLSTFIVVASSQGFGVGVIVIVAVTIGVGMIVAVGVGVGEENAGVTKFMKMPAKKAIHKLKGNFLTFYASFLLKRNRTFHTNLVF